MHFGRRKTHFVGVMIAGCCDTPQDIAHLRLVVDELQQRLAASPLLADAQDVLRRRIQRDDQEAVVEQDDARAQAVEDVCGVTQQRAAVVVIRRVAITVAPVGYRLSMLVCCT